VYMGGMMDTIRVYVCVYVGGGHSMCVYGGCSMCICVCMGDVVCAYVCLWGM